MKDGRGGIPKIIQGVMENGGPRRHPARDKPRQWGNVGPPEKVKRKISKNLKIRLRGGGIPRLPRTPYTVAFGHFSTSLTRKLSTPLLFDGIDKITIQLQISYNVLQNVKRKL